MTRSLLLALATLASASPPQNILAPPSPPLPSHHTSNFISSSIFRPLPPHLLSTLSLPPPTTLPPHYLINTNDFDGLEQFQGIDTFAHLDYVECMERENWGEWDIGIVGHPFDLGVSYRPGARFGPNGGRQGARRLSPSAGWDIDHGVNPFRNWAKVVDCGDIANTPFDKLVAIHELEKGMQAINNAKPKNTTAGDAVRMITIGGDHTITLPILRALHKTWGPVSVLHFDSHLDTWDPAQLGGGLTKYSQVNHGTMLHIAHEEGLLSNNSNMHLGSRCALFDEHFDLDNDARCGFSIVRARELDELGVEEVVRRVVERVGGDKVYLSVDIDVLDPAFAPATGTIEPGGWTTRELLQIISGLSKAGLKIVGADIVEFTPVYDNAAETTGIAVAQIVYEILQWMIHVPVKC